MRIFRILRLVLNPMTFIFSLLMGYGMYYYNKGDVIGMKVGMAFMCFSIAPMGLNFITHLLIKRGIVYYVVQVSFLLLMVFMLYDYKYF